MVSGDFYYYLATLPTPGELGSEPPVSPAQLLELVANQRDLSESLRALFLRNDLLQRESLLAGEVAEAKPIVLTPAQARNEAPLPAYLVRKADDSPMRIVPVDDLWELYFRRAILVARQSRCAFLAAWVGREVAVRNALVIARAERLGLEAKDYVVATDLEGPEEEPSSLISEWESATDPLAGTRVLIRAEWAWVAEHAGWFKFNLDEIVAYAAQLVLLERWQRLAETLPAETGASSH